MALLSRTSAPVALDPMALTSIDDHPTLRAARQTLDERQDDFDAQEARTLAAEQARQQYELQLARGTVRDDKRHDALLAEERRAQSHLRIAALGREEAMRTINQTRAAVMTEIARLLTAQHTERVRRLEHALQAAKVESDAAATIEDRFAQLLPRSSEVGFARPGGFSLPAAAWRREFTVGTGRESRFSVWRECCGVAFDTD